MRRFFFSFLLIVIISILSSCKSKEVMIPSYVYLSPGQLITKSDGTQGYSSAKIEDFYLFSNGETRGVMSVNSRVPLQNIGKTTLKISPGIKFNGLAEQRAIYPLFNYYSKDFNLSENKVDTIKPVFTYVENALFPFIEDFDGSGINLEYSTQFKSNGDTLVKDNSSSSWIPGKNSGKITLNSTNPQDILMMYSKVYSSWPRFTPFFLEMDYKGNIPITVGLITTEISTGTVKFKTLYITNPKSDWNKLYLDLETEINTAGTNMQFRLFFSFAKAGVTNPEAWLDNLKVIYLD
ncbi:MAG: hypothetical protein CFE21_09015 [Bacteroidetes bacterium B1(2017)]|nr:MAG: hypothetical protein CFE21_09015 [Bacteroidetes bacterium B1(2017)]